MLSPDSKLATIDDYESDRFVTRFFGVEGNILVPPKLKSVPFEGYASWKQPEELVTHECRFGPIQRALFQYLGIL